MEKSRINAIRNSRQTRDIRCRDDRSFFQKFNRAAGTVNCGSVDQSLQLAGQSGLAPIVDFDEFVEIFETADYPERSIELARDLIMIRMIQQYISNHVRRKRRAS